VDETETWTALTSIC